MAQLIVTIMISVQYRQVAKHVLTSEKRYLFLVLTGEMRCLHSPRQHKTALLALLMYSTGEPYNHSYIFFIVCQMFTELKLRVLFKTQNHEQRWRIQCKEIIIRKKAGLYCDMIKQLIKRKIQFKKTIYMHKQVMLYYKEMLHPF